MSKGNEIYEKMDRIRRRIAELEKKGGTRFYGVGEKLSGDTRTEAELEEETQLRKELEQLKKEDDKTQGII